MNQLKLSFVLGGALLGAVATGLGGCSDDDGSNVAPKDPSARAGSGGAGGGDAVGGSAGLGGSGGVAGGGGGGGTMGAIVRPACPPDPEPADAGVGDASVEDASVSDAGTGDAGDAAAQPRALSFAADIHPIFRMYCRPCHEDEFSGGHNLAADDPTEAYSFLVEVAPRLVERVNGGDMPPSCSGVPGDPGCITVAELELIQSWEAQCYPP